MIGDGAEDYVRGRRRPDDTPLMKPAARPALRPVPRSAIERLAATFAGPEAVDEPALEPKGRRKFRDQLPTQAGPRHRRQR